MFKIGILQNFDQHFDPGKSVRELAELYKWLQLECKATRVAPIIIPTLQLMHERGGGGNWLVTWNTDGKRYGTVNGI